MEVVTINLRTDFADALGDSQDFLENQTKIATAINSIRQSNRQLNAELRANAKLDNSEENVKRRAELNREIVANKNNIRQLSAEQRVFNKLQDSIANGTSEYERQRQRLSQIKRELKELSVTGRTAPRELVSEFNELDTSLRTAEESVGEFQRSVGQYENALKNISGLALDAFGLGDLQQVFSAANPAALATIAAGAAVAVGQEISRTVQLFEDLNNRVANITGLTGQSLADTVVGVQTISEVFEKDFNEVLVAANNLAQGFGISYEESLSLIRTGLQSGADIQGDFLQQIEEYPKLLANAGFSAAEFIKIANQQVEDGIYDDKLVDTLKEADIALKEFTQSQQDALEAAIGSENTARLQEGIRTGSITTRDAIQLIGDAVIESGADLQDLGTLTADVFKGAGEDAGGFGQIVQSVYSALNTELDDLVDETDAYIIRQNALFDATQDLNEANNILASQLAGLGTSFEGLGLGVREFFTESLSGLINFTQSVSRTLTNDGILGIFNGGLFDARDELRREDRERNQETQEGEKAAADAVERERQRRAEARRKEAADAREASKVIQDQLKREAEQRREAATAARELSKQIERQTQEQERLFQTIENFDDKALDDFAQELSTEYTQAWKTYNAEVDQAARNQEKVVEASKRFAEQTQRIANDSFADFNDADVDFIGISTNARIENARATITDEKELQAEITKILQEEELRRLNIKIQSLPVESAERIKLERQLAQQRIDIEKQTGQTLANQRKEQAEFALNTSSQLLSAIQANQDVRTENELNAIDRQFEARLEAAEGNAELTERIQEEQAAAREAIERESFERNKKFALAQAAINGALAVTAILTVPDFTLGILSAARIAAAVALTAIQLSTIAAQEFHVGGIVGQENGTRSSDTALKPDEQYIKARKNERVIVDTAFTKDKGVQTITGTPSQIASALNHEIGGGIAFDRGAHFGAVPSVPEYIQQGNTIVKYGQRQLTAQEVETAMTNAVSKVQVVADVSMFSKALNKFKWLNKFRNV